MREEWEVVVSTWNEEGSGADKVIVTTQEGGEKDKWWEVVVDF